MTQSQDIKVTGGSEPGFEKILTPQALDFIAALERKFGSARRGILQQRAQRWAELAGGATLDFLPQTASIRDGDWRVAEAPPDLQDRRVEITGPVERKMMINALNSGAKVFMADLEDSLSPTWSNVIRGQLNLMDAVRRAIEFQSPEGKSYRLNNQTATLIVRPRGWHLEEKHLLVDGAPVSASLLDFGLYFFHNAAELLKRGSGPYFYLPKLEGHLEARLWNDLFNHAQDALGIPRGTIRATVLVETIPAAFEMEEILYELRDHSSGFNAGRWDYIFSLIKKFHRRPEFMLPDRAQVTMAVPFMRAYADLLVKTCHRRGAHAIGGMAAFIPSRRDAKVNEVAMAKVTEDKQREAGGGFDGTWVAHPDLVPIAQAEFDRVLGEHPHQKQQLRQEVRVSAGQLLDVRIPGGKITEEGLRNNVSVALQYLAAWLEGLGAVAIYNLMEDAATAEIARTQIWQWIRHGAPLADGRPVSRELYQSIRDAELQKLASEKPGRYQEAAKLLDQLALSETFEEFLTLPAYQMLEN